MNKTAEGNNKRAAVDMSKYAETKMTIKRIKREFTTYGGTSVWENSDNLMSDYRCSLRQTVGAH